MNRNDLFSSFEKIDEEILEASEPKTISRKTKSRLPLILVAALLALLLMGAGVAAIVYSDSIQSWFGYYWESITGQEMSSEQTALIDHLSQDIGISKTVNNLTVTVDSATVGEDSFFLLLRIEGIDFSKKHSYGFTRYYLSVSPDPMEESGGHSGYGITFIGLDGDGAALLLIEYDYILDSGYSEDLRSLELALSLTDFAQNANSDRRKLLVEGEWDFTFTIQRNKPEMVEIPNAEVMAFDLTQTEQYTEAPVIISDIELTNTGLCFQYDYKNGTLSIDSHVYAILNNGQKIGITSGSGTRLEDSGMFFCTYIWSVPINLDEVVAISIGGVNIPVE